MSEHSKPKTKPGWLVIQGREYAPEHIHRIDDVVRRRHAGETQEAALVGAGYSNQYLDLFQTPVYLERYRCWTARLEAEYLDQRGAVFLETLTLARNPEIPPHVRERAYRTLGKWCGLERGPLLPPGQDGGKPDAGTPDSGGTSTNEPVLADFEVMRTEVESGQQA